MDGLDHVFIVEVNGDDLLIDDFCFEEGGLFSFSADIVPYVTVERAPGRRCSKDAGDLFAVMRSNFDL